MNITVLGATGPTGTQIVTRALLRELTVTALVRDPSRLTISDPRLTVVVGDATKADDVANAIDGRDAVLSALGSGRSRKSDIASQSVAAFIEAAGRTGVRRVVWLSALGVGDSAADGGSVQRLMWKAVMGQVFADKAVADRALSQAGLAYTLVYPATLSNKPEPGAYTAAAHVKAGLKSVSRAAVAEFMLDQLADDRWLNAIVELAAA